MSLKTVGQRKRGRKEEKNTPSKKTKTDPATNSRQRMRINQRKPNEVTKLKPIVESMGQKLKEHLGTPFECEELGKAVLRYGSNSHKVIQKEQEIQNRGGRNARRFLSYLHRMYTTELERLKELANLDTCCICMSAVDDRSVRAIPEKRTDGRATTASFLATAPQFVRLHFLPKNPNQHDSTHCKCAKAAICMTCFLKMIRASPQEDCIRVKCPTCSIMVDFDVGTMKQNSRITRPIALVNHDASQHQPLGILPFTICGPRSFPTLPGGGEEDLLSEGELDDFIFSDEEDEEEEDRESDLEFIAPDEPSVDPNATYAPKEGSLPESQ